MDPTAAGQPPSATAVPDGAPAPSGTAPAPGIVGASASTANLPGSTAQSPAAAGTTAPRSATGRPEAPTPFDINPALDPDALAAAFKTSRRIRIPDFLTAPAAQALHDELATGTSWRSFVVANERLMGTPPGPEGAMSPEEEQELIQFAHKGAENGYASLYEANRSLPDDDPAFTMQPDSAFARFHALLNSDNFLALIRRITGLDKFAGADAQAVRYRAGHFLMFHDGTFSADKTGKRRASYVMNLTPEWRPEWGGLQEFRTEEAAIIEGYEPCFNTLDLFGFPMGHWTSLVTPLAAAPRFAVSGSLYIK